MESRTTTDGPTEYRITWSASSHYSFGGSTDWYPLDGESPDELEAEGLCQALEASGFDWKAEFR